VLCHSLTGKGRKSKVAEKLIVLSSYKNFMDFLFIDVFSYISALIKYARLREMIPANQAQFVTQSALEGVGVRDKPKWCVDEQIRGGYAQDSRFMFLKEIKFYLLLLVHY